MPTPMPDDPISDAELQIFVDEVLLQAKFAAFAYNNMVTIIRQNANSRNLKEPDHPDTVRIHESFWFSIHSLTAALVNLSKLLWPASDRSQIRNRGEALREALEVPNNSPFRDRKMRDQIDNIDGYLETWARKYASSNPGGMHIKSGGNSNGKSTNYDDFLRNFEFDVAALTFQGEMYEIEPIIKAVQALLDKEPPA